MLPLVADPNSMCRKTRIKVFRRQPVLQDARRIFFVFTFNLEVLFPETPSEMVLKAGDGIVEIGEVFTLNGDWLGSHLS